MAITSQKITGIIQENMQLDVIFIQQLTAKIRAKKREDLGI